MRCASVRTPFDYNMIGCVMLLFVHALVLGVTNSPCLRDLLWPGDSPFVIDNTNDDGHVPAVLISLPCSPGSDPAPEATVLMHRGGLVQFEAIMHFVRGSLTEIYSMHHSMAGHSSHGDSQPECWHPLSGTACTATTLMLNGICILNLSAEAVDRPNVCQHMIDTYCGLEINTVAGCSSTNPAEPLSASPPSHLTMIQM
jgi:hypothetical protein